MCWGTEVSIEVSRSKKPSSVRKNFQRLPACAGQEVLACNCYQDSFTEVRHVWTVSHHCKEVWASGQTCYAKGDLLL